MTKQQHWPSGTRSKVPASGKTMSKEGSMRYERKTLRLPVLRAAL
jgi:hypothetical protein